MLWFRKIVSSGKPCSVNIVPSYPLDPSGKPFSQTIHMFPKVVEQLAPPWTLQQKPEYLSPILNRNWHKSTGQESFQKLFFFDTKKGNKNAEALHRNFLKPSTIVQQVPQPSISKSTSQYSVAPSF